jgi:hypothetical protein
MRVTSLEIGAAAIGIASLLGIVAVAGLAAAAGTGYNLTYTAAANSNIDPSIDLVSVSTTYSGGPNLTASFTVAGTPVTDSSDYNYVWLFGGDVTGDSTAWAFVQNGSAYLHSVDLYLPEPITYTVSGSSVSISVNVTLVGPASGFTYDVYNTHGNATSGTTSCLGTVYDFGGSCSESSPGGGGSGSGSSAAPFPIGAIIWPVLIVVIVVVVLLVRRRRRASATPPAPPSSLSSSSAANPPPPPAS